MTTEQARGVTGTAESGDRDSQTHDVWFEPIGSLEVEVSSTWTVDGERNRRTWVSLGEAAWRNPYFTARTRHLTQVRRRRGAVEWTDLRAQMVTESGQTLHLEYPARIALTDAALDKQDPQKSPAIITGHVDSSPEGDTLRWLGQTRVVGHGALRLGPAPVMVYEMHVLRWTGDGAPSNPNRRWRTDERMTRPWSM